MGESITEEEVNTMVKIAGVKSSDKINFKEFVDFFYKIDWMDVLTDKTTNANFDGLRQAPIFNPYFD